MTALTINHALGSYPVQVEPGVLVLLREMLAAAVPGRRLVLIADETVARLYDEWTSGTPKQGGWAPAPATPACVPASPPG
jgi:hypothetical protein